MARRPRQGPIKADFILNSRDYNFQAQVDAIVANTEKRMMLVVQQSLQTAVNEMQKPTAKGGKMRVDTGFLRASGQSSLNGMPTGPSMKPKDAAPGQFGNSPDITANLAAMTIGSKFHFGWTANYARYREAYDGFMYAVVQDWQNIVNRTVEEARKRFK